MKIAVKIVAGLVSFIILAFIGLSIFVATLDADKYRPQIVQTLSEKTGRKVALKGPIGFSLGIDGVHVAIQDASIGNPSWASRPDMAVIGKFEIGVNLLPLMDHRLEINKLSIQNADILLETNASAQHNWDMSSSAAVSAPPQAKAQKASPASAASTSLSVDSLTIGNSQLGMRGADGKTSTYTVSDLTLGMQGAGAVLDFKGNANGTAITIKAKTGITDLLSKAAFPFDADLTYGAFKATAKGTADLQNSRATIEAYELDSGKTALKGTMSASWGGVKPVIQGKLTSDHIDPADFKPASASTSSPQPAEQTAPSGEKRMFSTAPLPLDGLKAVNANLQVNIGELVTGKSALKNISATLALTNGDLSFAPVKATVGDKILDMQLKLDASQSPAHLTVGIIGNDVDLGELQKLGSMSPFMTGKAGTNIQLSGIGNSPHDIAASLGGVITITAEKGEIIGNAVSGISSALATIFSPQGGDSTINCLGVRFIAKGGVLNDNGMLIDSAASTVAGKGNVNLGLETVDLNLHAKTKLVDIGGLVPGLQIGGTLSKPNYHIDAVGSVKNLLGNLVNGNVGIGNSTVPDIQSAPAGQNACIYTLDHPKAASSSSVLPADTAGKASQQIKNLGNSLLKGLMGQ